jgi:hypothetical protein
MMEAARTSETLVNFCQTTWRYNPEDSHLQRESYPFKVTITKVTKVVWGFPNQSLLCTETYVGHHIKCPLFLSSFTQNWNALTTFGRIPQYHIS